ncbi:MAG: ArsR family transcriptional regulator [Hyphomicrobiales bacterium]|nr:MAG: ArsR family transcriptional regulator [Hyphomicrobiales bacterium]
MLNKSALPVPVLINGLKAMGEVTRIRIVALLAQGELTVKDLTAILGQSQPRISRHLKLLLEAGLIERLPEGAWAYFRLAEGAGAVELLTSLIGHLDLGDPVLAGDRARFEGLKEAQRAEADRYFAASAAEWDRIRSLHAPETSVEAAMASVVGDRPFEMMADLGTGTGRLLELFRPLYGRAVGIDASHSMLAVARANLDRLDPSATGGEAQVRQGDLYALPLASGSYDLVTIHQVLHFLADPARALREAARIVRPGGRILVVDFAPHDLEFLRSEQAHRRLGFSHAQVEQWAADAGLVTEEIRDLAPEQSETGKLTVTLWLFKDPRILMADTPALSSQETFA